MVVWEEHDVQPCHHAIDELLGSFAPTLGEPISVGYSDLTAARIA